MSVNREFKNSVFTAPFNDGCNKEEKVKRKSVFLGTVGVIIMLISFIACRDNTIIPRPGNMFDEYSFDPVSIKWYGDKEAGLQSYQANVEVWSKNSRTNYTVNMVRSYRLAIKTIDGAVYTRIDLDGDKTMPARSVISNGEEMVIINSATNAVEYRLPAGADDTPFAKLFSRETGLGRINLSLIREEAKRLSLNMSEDGSGKLLLDLPNHLFFKNPAEEVISRRASFNLADETLAEVKIVANNNNGMIVTTTTTPIYETYNNEPVKVGMVTTVDSKATSLIAGMPNDIKIYNSINELPAMDKATYERLKEEGKASEVHDFKLGNPADLSNTETIIEVYSNIDINNVPDSLFRAILN